jgi:uncharacterized protein (DUF983 family)
MEDEKKSINKYISPFTKECPICNSLFKDFLDKKIICISCEREQKINQILI